MKNAKKYLKPILFCVMISLFLEVIIFNYKAITSFQRKGEVLDNFSFSKGITIQEDHIKVKNNDYIELTNINQKVKTLNLAMDIVGERKYFTYQIEAIDEGSSLYYALPERYFYPYIEKSKYVSLNLSGKALKLKINFILPEKEELTLKLNSFTINPRIPFHLSITRFCLVFLSLLVLYIIRPKSELYRYQFNLKSKKQRIIIGGVFIAASCIFLFALKSNDIMNRLQGYSNHFQYQDLAVSLAKGKPYLEIEPSKEIKQMKNPYDFNYRQKLIEEKNAAFEWDRAYHEGKYYVYFGIVPAVLSYLPYYLITGMPLSNAAVIFIVSILTMLGIFLFLKEVVKRYFPKTSLLLFLLLFLFITMGSGLLGILSYATLYNVPIVFALAFTFFGLYFILSSIQKEKLCWWRILLGSCCMALVVGCRPQLFVGSFLLIPLLWEEVFKKRTLFSKKSIGQTFCFILPYLIVAILLMYYNKIRFGSVFDFGANYNITGNDMTRRGFIFDRIGLGVFSYLLQPMSIKATFPFLTKVLFNTNYMGITIHEPLFGGLLTCSPLLFLGVFFFKFKYYMPSKKLYYFNMGCIISAFLLVILDTQMAGILQRYFSDFAWLFYLPTIFIILSIANKKIDKKYLKLFLTLVVVFITVSFAYQFLLLFEDQFLHDLVNSSTDFFFKWYYLLQWWL